MTSDVPIARVAVGHVYGQRKGNQGYRLVGPDDQPLLNRSELPIDNGGYLNKNVAEYRAQEINEYYDKRQARSTDDE